MTELLPCPFCGGPALFEYVRHGGTMSSGMEPPTCYAGCKKCGVRFSGGETQGWDSTRRWYDRLEESHDKAAEQWNTRHQPALLRDAGDAARYRWLRGKMFVSRNRALPDRYGLDDYLLAEGINEPDDAKYIDAAIDAAMHAPGGAD